MKQNRTLSVKLDMESEDFFTSTELRFLDGESESVLVNSTLIVNAAVEMGTTSVSAKQTVTITSGTESSIITLQITDKNATQFLAPIVKQALLEIYAADTLEEPQAAWVLAKLYKLPPINGACPIIGMDLMTKRFNLICWPPRNSNRIRKPLNVPR